MPRNVKKGKYAANKFEFINLAFDANEIDEIVAWITARNTPVVDCMIDIADRGYKLTVSHNSWSGMYAGAVMCKDVNRATYNKCITYDHMEMDRLVRIMLYVVTERLESGDAVIAPSQPVNDW